MRNIDNLAQTIKENYIVLNGKIEDVITNIPNKNTFTMGFLIKGDNWQCIYGNFNLFDDSFDSKNALFELLKTLEETNLFKLIGKNVRVAVEDTSKPVELLGNIIYDKWYNFTDYYMNKNIEEDINKVKEFLNNSEEHVENECLVEEFEEQRLEDDKQDEELMVEENEV